MADAQELERLPVRFFGVVTPEESTEDHWGDVTWDYYQAMRQEFAIRVMPDGVLQQYLFSNGSRWEPYGYDFARLVGDPFLNVVCGNEEALRLYWTEGVPNVAITTIPDLKGALRRGIARDLPGHSNIFAAYDLVACLSEDDAVVLRDIGVIAKHLQPDGFVVALSAIEAEHSKDPT